MGSPRYSLACSVLYETVKVCVSVSVLVLVLFWLGGGVTPLVGLLDTHGLGDKPMDDNLRSFLELCLAPLPSKRQVELLLFCVFCFIFFRASSESLLSHVYLKLSKSQSNYQPKVLHWLITAFTNCSFYPSVGEYMESFQRSEAWCWSGWATLFSLCL